MNSGNVSCLLLGSVLFSSSLIASETKDTGILDSFNQYSNQVMKCVDIAHNSGYKSFPYDKWTRILSRQDTAKIIGYLGLIANRNCHHDSKMMFEKKLSGERAEIQKLIIELLPKQEPVQLPDVSIENQQWAKSLVHYIKEPFSYSEIMNTLQTLD
ncbi:hypothetical protein N9R79_12155 [Vibrio sp.]|nr:hypothetical protein [Vibrio sp.]